MRWFSEGSVPSLQPPLFQRPQYSHSHVKILYYYSQFFPPSQHSRNANTPDDVQFSVIQKQSWELKLFSSCRGSFLAILTSILFSASCLQTAATSLTLVGNLCCQWSMLADLLLNCTLSNITVTALSSSLSTSPYKTGILSTAVSKKKNILHNGWVQMLQHNLKSGLEVLINMLIILTSTNHK